MDKFGIVWSPDRKHVQHGKQDILEY